MEKKVEACWAVQTFTENLPCILIFFAWFYDSFVYHYMWSIFIVLKDKLAASASISFSLYSVLLVVDSSTGTESCVIHLENLYLYVRKILKDLLLHLVGSFILRRSNGKILIEITFWPFFENEPKNERTRVDWIFYWGTYKYTAEQQSTHSVHLELTFGVRGDEERWSEKS